MNLNLVAQLLELVVYMNLLRPWLLARALKLNEEWAPARNPEESIWITGVAHYFELRAFDPQMFPNEIAGFQLDPRLEIFTVGHGGRGTAGTPRGPAWVTAQSKSHTRPAPLVAS